MATWIFGLFKVFDTVLGGQLALQLVANSLHTAPDAEQVLSSKADDVVVGPSATNHLGNEVGVLADVLEARGGDFNAIPICLATSTPSESAAD